MTGSPLTTRLSKIIRILLFRSEITILLTIIIISIYFYMQNPLFASFQNIQNTLRWIATYSLMAVGEMFVLICGGIDLSVGSVVALAGLLVAYFMVNLQIPWYISVILVLIIAASIGLWHGLFTCKFSPPLPHTVPSFLVTLGTALVARGFAQYMTKGYPIITSRKDYPEFTFLGDGFIIGVPTQLVLLIVILIVCIYLLNLSAWGRHIYAVGGNLQAARVSGVSINKVRTLCYVLSSMLGGLTGVIITARLNSAYPGVGGGYELTSVASCALGGVSLIGGEGNPLGAIVGIALITIIQNGLVMLNVSPYLYQILIGVILFIAISIDFLKRLRRLTH